MHPWVSLHLSAGLCYTSRVTSKPEHKALVVNRKARHDYEVLDRIEAGIALAGTEVKSIRDGRVQMGDAYASVDDGEAFLHQLQISHFPQANQFNHEPLRKRKLLLHKSEIRKLRAKVLEKGLTLIPLSLYLVKNRVKVELGLCRGKKLYDKRATVAERDAARDLDRVRRDRYRG